MKTEKSQHTPGPWIVLEDEDGADQIKSLTRDQAPFVILPNQGICGKDVPQAVANASLIAAAPELLEAAKLLDQWLATEFPAAALGRKDEEKRIELLRGLRAAIEKAEGNR